MRMQRPIILTAKHRMYGDTFDTAQTHEHVYECVQPLQAGRISFATKTDKDQYVNNLSFKPHTSEKKTELVFFSWDTIIWLLIVLVSVGCMVMTFDLNQTAFNDVFLTQFKYDINQHVYSLQKAGIIKPLPYMIAALTCFSCSIIVGWQSNNNIRLNRGLSIFVQVLIFILQGWGVILHGLAAFDKFDRNDIMLSVTSVICLHIATTVITLVIVWCQGYFIPDESPANVIEERRTESMFWLTVAEDLNTIVGYCLVVTAFNALASVHDDTTVFFDVVCVVMIGFLQHIANVLMIFHRHIRIENTVQSDEIPKIVNVIARSRLLIFFFICAVVVFFYLRISPTYEAFTLGIPYEILRALAVLTMVSMGTFHSMWYELRHAHDAESSPKEWETSPTWKLATGALMTLLLSAFIWQNAQVYSNEGVKYYLDNGAIKP